MNLFLLRHGLAVERTDFDSANDAARPLTPKGKHRLRQTAAAWRALELHFDAIWFSPLVRARQTAEIMATELKLKMRMTPADELKPGGNASRLVKRITALKALPGNLLLVGHEPDLGALISLFVTGQPGAGFALKKGGLAKLELETLRAGQCATLSWLLTPGQMRLMV
jgi:phosphohistidine phosphatase